MKLNKLGNTGLEVGEVGFGAEWIEKMAEGELARIVARYEEAGVNLVDCWMADPAVRAALGEALEPHRDRWIIQGHIGSTWQGGQYVKTRDIEQVRPAFEELLRLLRTDHVELGMIHYVDDVDELQAILDGGPYLDYVHELKANGTIGHVGLSTHNALVGKMAALSGEVEMIMFSINPAYDRMPAAYDIDKIKDEAGGDFISTDPERVELYGICEKHGIGITVMKPYGGSLLLDAEKSPFGVELTPVQCIHYALSQPAVAAVLPGVETLEQAEAALAYETASDDLRKYERVLSRAPRNSYLGQCVYCGHCQPCSMGIRIADVNKLLDLAKAHDEVPASVRQHYLDMKPNASACNSCHKCESRCPFRVRISQRMREARTLFSDGSGWGSMPSW